MAANLLRVMRGAGRPLDLPQQIINLSGEMLEVPVRAWAVASAIQETLQSAVPSWYAETSEDDAYTGDIAKGALQFLASRLVHQRAQEAAGEREMQEAIQARERHVERRLQKWREEQALLRAQTVKPKRRKSKVTKPSAKKPLPLPDPIAEEQEPERPTSTAEFMRARQREMRGED